MNVANRPNNHLTRNSHLEALAKLGAASCTGTNPAGPPPVGQWTRVAIVLAAYAGLRVGEIVALRVADVNLPKATLRVSGKLGCRDVPIDTRLEPELEPAIAGKAPDQLVVDDGSGKPVPRARLNRRARRVLAAEGLPQTTMHDLRNRFMEELMLLGVHDQVVCALTGVHHTSRTCLVNSSAAWLYARQVMRRGRGGR